MTADHKFGDGWRGTLGVQCVDIDFEALGDEAFVPRSRTKAASLFAFEERHFDRWTIELGARTERQKIDPDPTIGVASFDATAISLSARNRGDRGRFSGIVVSQGDTALRGFEAEIRFPLLQQGEQQLELHLTGGASNVLLFLRASNLLDEDARQHPSVRKDVAPLPGRSLHLGVRAEF